MTIRVRDGTGTPRTITAIQVRDETNTPRDVSEIRVRDSNNVVRIVFSTAPDLTASASPNPVYGYSSGSGTATTNSSTVTPTGGVAPYTYAWVVGDYDGPVAPTANSPTAATSTFTQTSMGFGEGYVAQWVCTVTDDNGDTAQAALQTAFLDLGI